MDKVLGWNQVNDSKQAAKGNYFVEKVGSSQKTHLKILLDDSSHSTLSGRLSICYIL